MGNQEKSLGPAGGDRWAFYSHLSKSLPSEIGLGMGKKFLGLELVFPDTILCPQWAKSLL